MLRVTADTNIVISGLNFPKGKPFQFLELARVGKINLTVSDAILDEIAEARKRITSIARTVKPAVQLEIINEDPPDNRILECARRARILS